MPPLLDVCEDVRAEIGDVEADRLLTGETAPGPYDCTSCRTHGDTGWQATSTVLFMGQETAVLAFAHATCVPSQVVPVTDDQLRDALEAAAQAPPAAHAVQAAPAAPPGQAVSAGPPAARQAVLSVTSGLVLVGGEPRPGLVVEPTTAIVRPGGEGPGDDFPALLTEQGFQPVGDVHRPPAPVPGWSALLAMGQVHAVLMPTPGGGSPVAWWQAHQPMPVTEEWRTAAVKYGEVLVYASPAGTIGKQPREDQLRAALDRAAAGGLLFAAAMPLAGT
ncbi:hypothetical protein RKE29_23170 [Streptomyces sp. B1866]|uniref:hypothetical protein n=1 Tax=Streptomyces sp. B1866 TaxID=3075431 RepID=UPI002890F062|nr:hypothetical protein [Streptomyces sp. B1866]MDT3399512.1 hypothetical protein [Streptomyces sp. B1866]